MATDIILDDEGEERITLAAVSVKTTATDLIMDSPFRHKGEPGLRRALVHDANDGLTLNFNGDYSGGLTLNDSIIRLRLHSQIGTAPKLPRRAAEGDLFAVRCHPLFMPTLPVPDDGDGPITDPLGVELIDPIIDRGGVILPPGEEEIDSGISLWLCVRGGSGETAYWREIPLGDTVKGTA